MENQYLLLVSVLLGMTVGAVVYGVAATIVSIWSGEPEAAGDARRDSLLFLILRPIAKRIENSKGDAKELAECRRLLDAAGPFWGGMSAAEVLAVRYLMLPLGILWGAVIGGALELGGLVMLALGLAAALILRMLPVDALKRQADRRRRSFMKQLPGALDMLLIAGRAGMDLRNAILYLADHYIPGAVSEELQRVRRDLAFGASLSDALMEMAGRLGVTELTSLVVALTQSLETGTSISDTLSVFTSDLRRRRLLGAKEEAQTATVKIAFPMLLLIIPGIFIVLLGPVLLKLIHSVFSGV